MQANETNVPAVAIDDETGQLAVNAANPLAALAQETIGREAHNYDTLNNEQFIAYVRAISSPPKRLSECAVTDIDMVHYYCKPVEIADAATGEISRRVLTIIEDADGELYSTTSPGVFRTVLAIGLRPGGQRRFSPPLKVRIERVKSKYPSPALMMTIVGREQP